MLSKYAQLLQFVVTYDSLGVWELAIVKHSKVLSGGIRHALKSISDAIDIGEEGVRELIDLSLELCLKDHKGYVAFGTLELLLIRKGDRN
jgi:hypothetical protein